MGEEATLPAEEVAEPAEQTDPSRVEPRRIGRYQLCFQLAAGGMATVYLARALGAAGFEKLVALKRIHPHLAKERDYIDMFLDEARIASRITHSNVCSVFDFGEADGEHYIAMEYLVGESLSRVARRVAKDPDLRADPRYPKYIARIVADACEGLHAAHELRDSRGRSLNVVHRDVSPSNVFVSYDGITRVVDFGIASAANRLTKTNTGVLKGKIAYMAPEQIRRGTVNRQTDVWALGIMLWELLTFHRLFRRESEVETMYAILEADVSPPSEVRSSVPKELDAICLRALSRRQEDRYPTTREMGQDLLQFLAHAGDPVGLAAVAGWMERLFPDGEARKRQLMELAHHVEERVPRVGDDDSRSHSTIQTAASALATKDLVLPKRRWPAPVLGLAALLAVAAGGAWAMGLFDGSAGERPGGDVVAAPPLEVPTEPEEISVAGEEDEAPGEEAPAEEAPPEERRADPSEAAAMVDETPATDPAEERRLRREQAREERRRRAEAARMESAMEVAPTPMEVATMDEPPPAMEEPRATTGVVRVVISGGWARIYDGSGRYLGDSPTQFTLPAGPQRLQLRPFGQPPPQYVTVDVPAGGTIVLRRSVEAN